MRPDEVLAEAHWPDAPPSLDEVNATLVQLACWGNLESRPDMARKSNLNDSYRARFLYRLSQGGEAVELVGEALTEQAGPESAMDRQTGDGLLHVRLEPQDADRHAAINTPGGVFAGRDHLIAITRVQAVR